VPPAASAIFLLGGADKKDKWKDTVDTSVLSLIKMQCTGMPFDFLLLNKLKVCKQQSDLHKANEKSYNKFVLLLLSVVHTA
jgi:hypothetical protein